jgi:hypothetical protein
MHKRPPGRPPLDHEWCTLQGEWRYSDKLAASRRRKEDVDRLRPHVVPPKRGRSAYVLFIMDLRRKFKAGTDPESKAFRKLRFAKDQTAVLSRRWRDATPEVKGVFHAQSDAEKAAAATARRDLTSTSLAGRTTLQSLVERMDNPPRRPPPPFLLFAGTRRASTKKEHPHATQAQLMKSISAQWWALSFGQRKAWTERHRELHNEFDARMAPIRTQHAIIVEAEEEEERRRAAVSL